MLTLTLLISQPPARDVSWRDAFHVRRLSVYRLAALLTSSFTTPAFTTNMFFMRILGCVSALILALAVTAQDTPTELKIDTTFLPEDCKVKSQNGDRLQVHYVRSLGDITA